MSAPWGRPVLYDAMVNWEARRAREMPFYKAMLPPGGRILDVACGTGHHATWLAAEGFAVEGCDLSEAMLDVARRHAAEAGVDVPFFVADMTALPEDRGPYDGVFCVGNALFVLETPGAPHAFFEGARRLLRPGGRLLFQVLNDGPLLAQPRRFDPVRAGSIDGREVLFLKSFDFTHGARDGRVDVAVMWRGEGGWKSEVGSSHMTAWSGAELEEAAAPLRLSWYGNHAGDAFDPASSTDRIGVATK